MAENNKICVSCAAKDDFKHLRSTEEGVAQVCHVPVWLIHLGQLVIAKNTDSYSMEIDQMKRNMVLPWTIFNVLKFED